MPARAAAVGTVSSCVMPSDRTGAAPPRSCRVAEPLPVVAGTVDISLIPPRKRDYSKAKQEPKHDSAAARPSAQV